MAGNEREGGKRDEKGSGGAPFSGWKEAVLKGSSDFLCLFCFLSFAVYLTL